MGQSAETVNSCGDIDAAEESALTLLLAGEVDDEAELEVGDADDIDVEEDVGEAGVVVNVAGEANKLLVMLFVFELSCGVSWFAVVVVVSIVVLHSIMFSGNLELVQTVSASLSCIAAVTTAAELLQTSSVSKLLSSSRALEVL